MIKRKAIKKKKKKYFESIPPDKKKPQRHSDSRFFLRNSSIQFVHIQPSSINSFSLFLYIPIKGGFS